MKKKRLLIFLLIVVFYSSFSQKSDTTSRTLFRSWVSVTVVNYDQSWEYRFSPEDLSLNLISQTTKSEDARWPEKLPVVLRQLENKKEVRINNAKQLVAKWASGVKWAEYSQEKKYVIIGHENPVISVISNVSIFETGSGSLIKTVECDDGIYIMDIAWSVDSKYLLILKTKERWSKSIDGLFGIIFGHPIPLESFIIEVLDISSGKFSQKLIAKDIKYGEGVISIQSPP
jgi:hypothetical protein